MEKTKYVVDTNILMEYPRVLNEDWEIVIATDVLRELDGLKNSVNPDTAFKARRAAICITRALEKDNITFNQNYEDSKMSVDDKLLHIVCDIGDAILVTNDVYLKVKAVIDNFATKGYGGQKDYEGILIMESSDIPDYDSLLGGEDIIGLRENQFLKVMNGDTYVSTFVKENGSVKEINPFKARIRNSFCGEIKPKNVEQGCLMRALADESKTIFSVGGRFGAGY